MLPIIIQIIFICLFPWLSQRLTKAWAVESWLSPVVLCYTAGILVANLGLFPLDNSISTTFTEMTIIFAIPLLLYSTDILAWLRYARSTVLSFGLCVLSGIILTLIMGWFFQDKVPDAWRISGMLLGFFTGGAPNMQAIGLALGASEEDIVLLNAADIVCGGIYLIFLTSVAHRFFGIFLRDFEGEKRERRKEDGELKAGSGWQSRSKAAGLTVVIVGIAVGLTWLVTGAVQAVVLIILLLTTLSIAASFSPTIRNWNGTFEMGEYLLLMFCVAIGLLADFSTILDKGLFILAFMASVWLGMVVLHSLLAWLFRIDRDTAMITSTAAIYGPIFVGQVASAIGNRALVFSGMATGLVGYAVGNYLGIGVAYVLKWLLS